jgi:eukaryotic-like serine/threonine-protein kinase
MGTEELLGGRYRLDHVAGHGGAATVFSAHDTVLDRTVAIKLLQRRHDETGVLHQRFEREARAEARVVHPNVVSVHDVGETEDGRPYIVMDYVDGRSLQEIIAEDGPLSSERVAIVGMGIARALAAAHALGIVHRDVKPANVIIDGQGIPHLMDFGLARELFDADPGVTAPGVLVGTAYYVAPEQARYGTASPASDLYSLGGVLYHALAGEPPFVGGGALDVALRRFEEEPEELRARVPAADADLAALIHALLARDPVERPWDASAVSERLGDIGARLRATRTAGESQAPL